jgi:uncharacterized protein YmfQ (DUF2313 family)
MAAIAKILTLGLVSIGLLTVTTPAAWAAEPVADWEQGKAQLEQVLPTGQPRDFYSKKLQELGFTITSTNYATDDYLEYEVVKGNQSYEVQLDLDNDTKRVSAVDIALNIWQTEATEQTLAQRRMGMDEERIARADRPDAPAARANRYSDRDRARSKDMIKELEALPLGQTKEFYRDELKRRGYTISKVNTDNRDELDLETVKNGHSIAMEVEFDEETAKSTSIDADTMWVESESTERMRTKTMDKDPADKDELWQQGQAQLQRALPAGQPPDFYAKKLKELGYKVTSVNDADEDNLEYEIVKGEQTYEVQIDIDDNTNKATDVEIGMNLWKTEATNRVVDRQQMR